MWNTFNLTVDAFIDRRDNIFMVRQTLPGTMGIGSVVWGNVGKMKSWGMDGTASYSYKLGEFDLQARGNLTITRDRIDDYDEPPVRRSEEHTSELQSLMRISYAVFCLKTQK